DLLEAGDPKTRCQANNATSRDMHNPGFERSQARGRVRSSETDNEGSGQRDRDPLEQQSYKKLQPRMVHALSKHGEYGLGSIKQAKIKQDRRIQIQRGEVLGTGATCMFRIVFLFLDEKLKMQPIAVAVQGTVWQFQLWLFILCACSPTSALFWL